MHSGLCLCDSAQAQQLKQQLRSAQVAGQWRWDTASTFPLFWRRSTVSPVSFGRYPRSSLHSFVPPPPPPRSLISHLAFVDVKQNGPIALQELCESRGVRPGLSVLTSLLVFLGRKAILNHASALVSACS